MNPPLRDPADRSALLEGLADGTIDMIATDHAPHSAEEKSRGLRSSLMGVVGLETAFPLLYTYLVQRGVISLERLLDLMCIAPRQRFGLPGGREVGQEAHLSVWDLNRSYTIDPSTFRSMGRSTPFAGWSVQGACVMTVYRDKIVYQEDML